MPAPPVVMGSISSNVAHGPFSRNPGRPQNTGLSFVLCQAEAPRQAGPDRNTTVSPLASGVSPSLVNGPPLSAAVTCPSNGRPAASAAARTVADAAGLPF